MSGIVAHLRGGPKNGAQVALPSPTLLRVLLPARLDFLPCADIPATLPMPQMGVYVPLGPWSHAPSEWVYEWQGPNERLRPTRAARPPESPRQSLISGDAHSVSFSQMSVEADAEMAEWDAILHPPGVPGGER